MKWQFYFFPKKLRIDPCFLPAGGEIFFLDDGPVDLPLLAAAAAAAGATFFGGGSTTSASSSEQLTSSISRMVSKDKNMQSRVRTFSHSKHAVSTYSRNRPHLHMFV